MRALRRGRRRRSRGTAMIELIIVTPIIIVTWASINHFRNTLLLSQQVLHESRTQAWAYATSGKCNHSKIPSLLMVQNFGAFGDEAIPFYQALPSAGSILSKTASVDSAIGRAGPTPTNVPYLRQASTLVGRTYLHCNDELPSPKNQVPQILPIGFQYLTPF